MNKPQNNNIILYQTSKGNIKIDAILEDENVWLSQKQIGELFDKNRKTIGEHIKNIFNDGELNEKVVCRKFQHTTKHGAIKGKTQNKSAYILESTATVFPFCNFNIYS